MKRLSLIFLSLIFGFCFAFGQKGSAKIPNNVLYIVDGHPVKSKQINSIKPDDMVQVTVLKGEASLALYGKKGKNGTILITTRKAAIRIYHTNLSKASPSYAEKLSEIKNENDVLYVLNGKPLFENYEGELIKLKPEQIREIILIDSDMTKLRYEVVKKEGAVEIFTIL